MNDPVLILVLMQGGIEPTPEAVRKLDDQISQLAEILPEYL
jgi:hypothetical protein